MASELLGFETRDIRPLASGGQPMVEKLNYRNQLSSGDENPNARSVKAAEREEVVSNL